MGKTARGWNRCIYCGKFFSIDDETESSYQPDTAFTVERIEHWHKECKPNNQKKASCSVNVSI